MVPRSLSEVAADIGTVKQVVSCWRLGTKRPGAPARATLHAKYGIDPSAWTRKPSTGEASPAPATPTVALGKLSSTTTLQECIALLESIRKQQRDPDLIPTEKVRLADAETRALALRAKLERDEEFLEERIVREHPFWKQIQATILAALKPHPAAARAVVEALANIGAA